jgi:AcrR family transcriptional regulator
MVQPAEQADQRLTRKGQLTRDRIIDAAAELVLTGGLSALRMDAVRQAASVSGSQLAHYFVGKRDLVRAVLARQIEVVLEFHRQPRLGALDSLDDFERWLDLNLRYLRRIGYSGTPTFHGLVGQLAKSDDQTRAALAAAYQQWVAVLERAIAHMKDTGVLVPGADPRLLALVIIGAHQGGATMAFVYHQEWPLTDGLRFAVNHLRAFATDPAERVPRPPRRARARVSV